MRTGTKSLLFGVHQIFWHPVTVLLAWIWLYRELPNLKELVCIVIHDWGYWGKANMDDEDGESHPEWAAGVAHEFLDSVDRVFDPWGMCVSTEEETTYHDLCLYHSRHYARKHNHEPSKLCWADKCSIIFDPWLLYLPRAWATGELAEYRKINADAGLFAAEKSSKEWHKWVSALMVKVGTERRGDAMPYCNEERHK